MTLVRSWFALCNATDVIIPALCCTSVAYGVQALQVDGRSVPWKL